MLAYAFLVHAEHRGAAERRTAQTWSLSGALQSDPWVAGTLEGLKMFWNAQVIMFKESQAQTVGTTFNASRSSVAL
jgi:hypothetical protein